MTKSYQQRLIALAQELVELREPRSYKASDETEALIKMHEVMIESKTEFLLGYILALEEIE
jgi:hypothetical protein